MSVDVPPPASATTIVVGVDGAPASESALDWAIREAELSHRELLLVHVASVSDQLGTAILPLVGLPDVDEVGKQVLRRAAAKCEGWGVVHRESLVDGAVPARLVDASRGSAMLVLGAHGHRHGPLPPDSVLGACIARSGVPVVAVKGDPAADVGRPSIGVHDAKGPGAAVGDQS